jgi:hypothetical protein
MKRTTPFPKPILGSILMVALALFAPAAQAELFTVTLTSGNVVETSHEPQLASWDSEMVLLMTDVGNWIGLPKSEIETIEVERPAGGFGIRIATNTILLGTLPNDVPIDGGEAGTENPATQAVASALERMIARQDEQSRYSIDQFVEPNQSQGIPSSLIGGGGSPLDPDASRFLDTQAPDVGGLPPF